MVRHRFKKEYDTLFFVMKVNVIKGMWTIIRKDENQPQDSVYLWDQEGNSGFNYTGNILFFNIYQKQCRQVLIFIKFAFFVHWCLFYYLL